MNLKESLEFNNFLVIGNTTNEEKYAYKIKSSLLRAGKNVVSIKEDYMHIDDIKEDIDVLDLCINPNSGLRYLEETNRTFKFVIIQPGAESIEIKNYLEKRNIEYVEGCLLLALKIHKGIEVM